MSNPFQVLYATDGSTRNFNFPFQILSGEDILVYFNPVAASPITDTLFQPSMLVTNYVVTVADLPSIGGSILFPAPYAVGGAILINRSIANDLNSDFGQPSTFNGAALDRLWERQELINDQISGEVEGLNLHYDPLAAPSPDQISVVGTLQQNQTWVRIGNDITGLTIVDDPGAALLRTQLASKQQGSDGALLVGYYDAANLSGTNQKTLKLMLDEIVALLPIGLKYGELGDHKFSDQTADHTDAAGSWMLEDGRAISRTTYAAYNTLLAAASYPYGPGDGTTTFNIATGNKFIMPAGTTYPKGSTGGSATHTNTLAELAPHTHDVTVDVSPADQGGSTLGGLTGADPTTYTTNSAGSGTPYSILNPYYARNSFTLVQVAS